MSATLTDLDRQLGETLKGPSRMTWLVAGAVATFIGWSAVASLDEIVRAEGEIVSSSRPQIIQNLEGGILEELLVREGDIVAEGQILARLHGTRFSSEVGDLGDQITALEIRRLRLEAELAGMSSFDIPASLSDRNPLIAASERALLLARTEDFAARASGARAVLDQAEAERELMEKLFAEEVVALIEVTRARKAHADARLRYEEIVTQSELDRAQAHADTLRELATLRQTLRASEDQLARTVLRAPMPGVVNTISVTTIGGVVRPGEELLQITPIDDALFVEARVRPEDIAHIRSGQEANIKLTAYDYTIFGALPGRVSVVSADTTTDPDDRESRPHYKVLVELEPDALDGRARAISLRPGMQAQAELMTGEKTVLSYLAKPLWKSREALREP
ncbi:HlyD family efflux transporter periplasmic adaptor subunit [Litorisediminicola beolgyonensis]|uniref:HlyD family efflux transporter periplasmic adaptor subunit n=1 Tax=Litorisediminicola beolgyonensis TaxID=1173614 RepID=A0ABW3ZES2_9RHOB